MDLAKDRSSEQATVVRLLWLTFRLVNIGLIGYLVWQGLSSVPTFQILAEFTTLRNVLYAFYTGISLSLGVFFLSRGTDHPNLVIAASPLSKIVPMVVSSVILTTFAFAIAQLLLAGLNIIGQFVSLPEVTLSL